MREGAEYKYVTTGDKQATIALATYGELFSITRQAIINDDLNMLTDVPMKLGRAAKSTIADLVYAILTSNPKISTDNVSLFDKAKHANVLESAAMDVASLDKARQLMRVQKEGERHLNIRPAFVLVPTAMESVANQVIRSSSVKGADINAGIINPVKILRPLLQSLVLMITARPPSTWLRQKAPIRLKWLISTVWIRHILIRWRASVWMA